MVEQVTLRDCLVGPPAYADTFRLMWVLAGGAMWWAPTRCHLGSTIRGAMDHGKMTSPLRRHGPISFRINSFHSHLTLNHTCDRDPFHPHFADEESKA